MKVSIITVTFNSEKVLEKTILSVINQDYHDIEYIIIDGNSNDNTKKIIKSYANNVDVYISEPDYGIYDAINKGIKIAKGNIIGLLHSDDFLYDNNVISRVVNSFDINTDAVFADSFFIDHNNKFKRFYSSKNFKNWKFRFGIMPSHPTFYIKRDVLNGIDLYNITFKIAADFDFLLRLFIKYKIRYKYVNEIWVVMLEGGVSTKSFRSKLKISKEIIKSCKINNFYTNLLFINLRFIYKSYKMVFHEKN
jgi:glycosyltransferase involved in cell wall biosynthesis